MMHRKNPVMKNSTKYISLVSAAGVAGLALFALANASFTAALRGDVVMAITTSVSLFAFAVYDYSRRQKSLATCAQFSAPSMLRPSLPVGDVCNVKFDKHRIAA